MAMLMNAIIGGVGGYLANYFGGHDAAYGFMAGMFTGGAMIMNVMYWAERR